MCTNKSLCNTKYSVTLKVFKPLSLSPSSELERKIHSFTLYRYCVLRYALISTDKHPELFRWETSLLNKMEQSMLARMERQIIMERHHLHLDQISNREPGYLKKPGTLMPASFDNAPPRRSRMKKRREGGGFLFLFLFLFCFFSC